MAKLNCPCGNQLSNVMSPNEIEGGILTDIEIDRLYEKEEINIDDLTSILRDFWECPYCGRLAISLPNKKDNRVKWYCPEDKTYAGINKEGGE